MENFQEVLVPTDFSSASWQAVLAGIKLAKTSKASMSILHVTSIDDDSYNEMIEEKLRNLSSNLSEIYNLEIGGILRKGILEKAISDYIQNDGADIVVVGLDEQKDTSVSRIPDIIKSMNIPVVVVPPATLNNGAPQML
ncbi:MAG: universal stress protein [bacterium]|nr:universal stress protein [bacterium]